MSLSGKVQSWNGKFGFAKEDKEGKIVYIHKSEIDDGSLRVGRTVNFEIEDVEGHDGRVKGVNVSGEAVLPKGEKLTDEQRAEDKKLKDDARSENKERLDEEVASVKSSVDALSRAAKVKLVHALVKELELGQLAPPGTKIEERRVDPTQPNGPSYTLSEFTQFYGPQGKHMWNIAGMAKKGGKGARRK